MLKTSLNECQEFVAGDHTVLRELLHPAKQPLAIRYSLAHGILKPGQRSTLHVLASSEVYYFLAGQGHFTIDGQVVSIEAGTALYVPPGGKQSMQNTGTADIEFLCLVEPAWRREAETILE